MLGPNDNDHTEKHILNSAVIKEADGTFRKLYRAHGHDEISRLKWATSKDGINWKKENKVAIENPAPHIHLEDPRMTQMDDGRVIMLCTHADTSIPIASIGVYELKGDVFVPFGTVNKEQGLEKDSDKDGAMFPELINGQYVIMRRPFPHVKLARSNSLTGPWEFESEPVISPRPNMWDNRHVGGGSPPIKTPVGWFAIYHGVGEGKIYRLGGVLMDKDNPSKVIWRSEKPLLEPELEWEREGWVPNVTFSCNAVVHDDALWVWYAGADSKIGAAKIG